MRRCRGGGGWGGEVDVVAGCDGVGGVFGEDAGGCEGGMLVSWGRRGHVIEWVRRRLTRHCDEELSGVGWCGRGRE